MSNCIKIDGSIRASCEWFDEERLLSKLDELSRFPTENWQDLSEDDQVGFFFMVGAVEVQDGYLYWHPGEGYSSHTWRDFYAAQRWLGTFMTDQEGCLYGDVNIMDIDSGINVWAIYEVHIASKYWWAKQSTDTIDRMRYGYSISAQQDVIRMLADWKGIMVGGYSFSTN